MSVESIIFFLLALFVWGLSVAGRWLQEQMQKHSTDGVEFEPIEWSPQPEFEEAPKVPPAEAASPLEEPPPRPPVTSQSQNVRTTTLRRLGLGSPQTLRQGIILMTVLGPCRALESSSDRRTF
ncbi:hypothetical protein [Candidatus Nitronereus thalassa]|uniref:Uncharacterized protein n=1 Tax=Candidatus Nitronereus thalassa TaxID=3020898 RepID=A0ABU3KCD1_9BACT|nr:hypothetical protein [Candidatus Nitronereus thalassa]MDT7044081.1 hypothetical protein [Candidatus Nitronereus thalassa]